MLPKVMLTRSCSTDPAGYSRAQSGKSEPVCLMSALGGDQTSLSTATGLTIAAFYDAAFAPTECDDHRDVILCAPRPQAVMRIE
jgi:hypothetical protein